MPIDDRARLAHILDAAREAVSFLGTRSAEDLEKDRKLALALLQLLEVIGEASKGVSSGFREEHPELPWKEMSGMRDRLIHRYFDIDLTVIRQTIAVDLPPLIALLEDLSVE